MVGWLVGWSVGGLDGGLEAIIIMTGVVQVHNQSDVPKQKKEEAKGPRSEANRCT